MKILVLAIIAIAAIVGYQMLVTSVNGSYQLCLQMAKEEATTVSQLSCGAKREVYEELAQCITTVQEESNFKAILYGPLGFESEVNTLIETHNKECPQSVVKVPQEGLYVNN